MQKPKAADFDNEQDYLNNWAGWQVNTGSWFEPVPTDWKAPVVTPPTPVAQTSPQPNGMLTNTTTPQMAVEGGPQPEPVAQTSSQPDGMITNTATPQMAVEGGPQPVEPSMESFSTARDYSNAYNRWWRKTSGGADIATAPVPKPWRAWTDANKPAPVTPTPVAQTSPQPDGMLTNTLTPQTAVEDDPRPEVVASVPRPADYTSETDFLNAAAGYRISTGEFNLTPDDYSAWGNYQDSLSTSTEDTYEAPPADYVPEYVKPETTQIEDLFSNELGGSTEEDDPFAIDVESEDKYVSPPDDYVPEYTAPVETATGYREDNDVSSSPEVSVETATGYREDNDVSSSPEVSQDTATGYREDGDVTSSPEVSVDTNTDLNLADGDYTDFEVDYGDIDLSSLNNTFNQDAVLPEGYTEYTEGALGENFVPEWWPTYEEGVYAGQPVHYANLNDSQKELAKEYYTWADGFIEEGGSFGTSATVGDPANPLYFREQASTELYNSMTKQLEDLGLTPDDIDGDLLEMARMSSGSDTADQTERDTGYELFIRQVNPYITEKNQVERQALYDSLSSGDMESFNSLFSGSDINAQTNLLYRLYSEGGLSKEDYSKSMAGIHQEANPDYSYFFDDDELFRVATKTVEEDPQFAMSRGAIEYIRLFPDSGAYNYTDSEDVRGMDWEERFARNLGIPANNYHFSDDDSSWVNARDKVLIPLGRAALALYTAGATEKLYTAYKVATGETLNASDYVNIVVGGLEATGVIAPPAAVDGDMVNPIGGGTVGGQMGGELLTGGPITDGVGLFGLDYVPTVGVINAAINQDPIGVIAAGTGWMQQGFESLGVPPSVANDVDFLKAARETMDMLANGESVQDSMEAGFERYIKEGGGFGIELDNGDFFDFDFGVVGDAFDYVSDAVGTVSSTLGDYVDPVLQQVGNTGQDFIDAASDTIGDASSALGDYVDPVIEAVADAQEATAEVIGDVSSAVGDVTDPITSAIGDTADDIIDATGDVIDDTVDVIADTFEPLVDAADDIIDATGDVIGDLGDALPDLNLSLPDLNLGLPDFNLGYNTGMMSGTRTTDSLFGKDLFKFKTEIGVSPQEQLIQATSRRQQKQEYADLFEDPFSSTFNFKV